MPTTLEPENTLTPGPMSCDVAIVGYGPVGMVLSGLLAQRGFDVVIVERHHALYPLARAGHYDGETMRTFQELGVADAVELAAQPMLRWNLVTGKKEVLATIHLGEGGAGWKESYLSYQPRRIFAVNADSQFLMATAVMRSMRDNGWGRIVNLASNSLGLAVPGLVPYMAAKGAVVGFTRALATDLAPFGITVNAVCPTASRRGTVCFLSSDDAAFMTGQTLVADGGLMRV